MLAVLEAQTAQFEARMSAAGQQLDRWHSTTGMARRGMTQLRMGFHELAIQGLGVMPPALARVSTGLLEMFGAGGPMLIGVAVLGAVAFAFNSAGKAAEEFVADAQKVRDFMVSDTKMLAGVGPGFAMTGSEQLANLEVRRARAIALQQNIRTGMWTAEIPAGTDPTEALRHAQNRIDALQIAIRGFDRAIRDLGESLAAQSPIYEQWGEKVTNLMILPGPEGFRKPFKTDVAPYQPLGLLEKGGPNKYGPGFKLTPDFAQMMLFSALSAGRGGAGGFLSAGGSMLTGLTGMAGIAGHAAAGPLGWAGFALSTFGSLFMSNADKNAEKVVKAIEKIAQEVGLERVTLVFTGADGHQVRKSLAELEGSDAVQRVPGPVGATG